MLEPLLRTAAAVGLDLDVSSSRALANSLDRAVVKMPALFGLTYCLFYLICGILEAYNINQSFSQI